MYATVGVSYPILFINAALFKLPCPLYSVEFCVSGNKRISCCSLATVLFILLRLKSSASFAHKKLLISSAYDIPRNGCENLYPVVGATTETESSLVLLSSQLAPSSYIRRKEAPTW